ncbi:hypothetical protein NIES2130_05190 [Scytonema sp. HK-05]|nr:hypothetical protein NIES2130_05190 [Scytonema sp. HK-05]
MPPKGFPTNKLSNLGGVGLAPAQFIERARSHKKKLDIIFFNLEVPKGGRTVQPSGVPQAYRQGGSVRTVAPEGNPPEQTVRPARAD